MTRASPRSRIGRCTRSAPHRGGFTLMETLAAVLITSLVVTFAMGAYVQIAETAEMATQRLRDDLHATTILDRMTADLESAVLLVKPDEIDPLRHPWYFVAESKAAFGGSDAVRFIARDSRSYHADEHDSDFAQIAYQVVSEDDGTQTLYRWMAPGLPDEYTPGFPLLEDPRNFVLGEGLSGFTMQFSNGDGEWVDAWDSTLLTQSSLLPVSVEIRFDMGVTDRDGFDEALPRYRRRVVLPMQPIDLDAMIASAKEQLAGGVAADDEDDEDDDGASSAEQLQCIQNWCNSESGFGELCAQASSFWDQMSAAERAQAAAAAGCN